MSEQSVIVWDLETVPDLEATARMLDMGNASDAEVREALGTGFPKHLFGRTRPTGFTTIQYGGMHSIVRSIEYRASSARVAEVVAGGDLTPRQVLLLSQPPSRMPSVPRP
jgi:hypothetical protein